MISRKLYEHKMAQVEGVKIYDGLTPNQIASDSYKYANVLVNKLMEESQHK